VDKYDDDVMMCCGKFGNNKKRCCEVEDDDEGVSLSGDSDISTEQPPDTIENVKARHADGTPVMTDDVEVRNMLRSVEYVNSVYDNNSREMATALVESKNTQILPSEAHRNATWEIITLEGGSKHAKLVCEQNLLPAYGGPSANYGRGVSGYESTDKRPFKVLHLGKGRINFDIKCVDYELYWTLKRKIMFRPSDNKQFGMMREECNKFFNTFKTAHLDTALVANVIEATCLAAAVPNELSLQRIRRIMTRKAAKKMKDHNDFYVDGNVTKRRWFGLWKTKHKMPFVQA